MSVHAKLEELRLKDQKIRELQMQLEAAQGEFNTDLQAVLRELSLPESFRLIDVIQKTFDYKSGIIV